MKFVRVTDGINAFLIPLIDVERIDREEDPEVATMIRANGMWFACISENNPIPKMEHCIFEF